MEQESIIIGAVITLLSTTLSIFLTNGYHWINKKTERDQFIEDRNYQRRLEVLNRRLGEAEKNFNQFLDIAEKLIEYEFMLLASKALLIDDIPVAENNIDLYKLAVAKSKDKRKLTSNAEITEKLSEANRQRASVFNLNDEELIKLTAELGTLIINELNIADSLEKRIQNDEIIDSEVEQKRILSFNVKTLDIRKTAIGRIDHLAGFHV